MKTLFILAALSIPTFTVKAQSLKQKDVPAAVKENFLKKYPGVSVQKWEKEGPDFEAEFRYAHLESSAVFDAAGTFKSFEQEMKVADLPKSASDYCKANFREYKLAEAEKITDASGALTFEIELSKARERIEILFDEKGGFLKRSSAGKD